MNTANENLYARNFYNRMRRLDFGVEQQFGRLQLDYNALYTQTNINGGLLGSTFNHVFERQMENLQDGDRFYYLTRTQGQNLLVSLEQNSFIKMIMANTDLAQPGADGIRGTEDDIIARHVGVDSFAKYDFVLEVNAANQADYNGAAPGVDPASDNAVLEALGLGKVTRVEGVGDKAQVTIDFGAGVGEKRLLLRYSPVTKL